MNWTGPVYEISALSREGTRRLSGDLMTYIEDLNEMLAEEEAAMQAEREAQTAMQQEAREFYDLESLWGETTLISA